MKKRLIQAYFIDLDGTMLDAGEDNGFMSAENIEFLKELQKTTPVIPSTGRRPKGAVPQIMKLINAPYAVCSTGSVVADPNGEIIHSVNIKNETKNKLLKLFMDTKLNIIINGADTIYHFGEFNWNKRDWVKRFEKKSYQEIDKNQDIRQFLIFGLGLEETSNFEKYLNDNYPELATHVVSRGYSIEVTDKSATKGSANKYVAELLGLDIKKCAHIGDSKNDLLALPYVGYLVAMGNAETEIKQAASFIGEDYTNGGLARTIQKFEKFIEKTIEN